jgi:hypothetical protein
MPIHYTRDDQRRRAVIVITGPFDPIELLPHIEHHRTSGAWTYGLLYDLRYMTGEPTRETLREFTAKIQPRPAESPRGPVAILTQNQSMYSRACTYAAMARDHATIEVFRDLDEAEAWLSDHVS